MADIDRDGKAEILVASNALFVSMHLPDGGMDTMTIPLGGEGLCVAAQDLNGDGATDVAVCSVGEIYLFLNGCP
jgi:hypothetical protein